MGTRRSDNEILRRKESKRSRVPATKDISSPGSSPSSSPERILSGSEQSCWITKKEYTKVRLLEDMDQSDPTRVLTEHLQEYMKEIVQIPPNTWFHRKSYRLVLSMLQVTNPNNGSFEFIRGINSEISLPTGSICAERAAIVSARSRFPNLTRRHFQAIAVLNFPLGNGTEEQITTNPLDPCGACREYLRKFKNENFRVITYSDITCAEIHERFLFTAQVTREPIQRALSDIWFKANSLQPLGKRILEILDDNGAKLTAEKICQCGNWSMLLLEQRLDALIHNNLIEGTKPEEGEQLFELTPIGHGVVAVLRPQGTV